MNQTKNQTEMHATVASLEHVYKLKTLARSGWLQNDIPTQEVESIASHSYGMAIFILYLSSDLQERGIDVHKALSMALLHDIAESIVGDITPEDTISPDEKYAAESEAFDVIMNKIRDAEHFRELWDEFEAGESNEAKLVKRIDKLDMLFQAYTYEKKYSRRLDSFWEDMDDLFVNSESEAIYNYLRLNRYQLEG